MPFPTPEPQPGRPQAPELRTKSPGQLELDRLRNDYQTSKSQLDGARSLLKMARDLKAGGKVVRMDSPEYQEVHGRELSGESLLEIEAKQAAEVRRLYEATLNKELPYCEKEADLLRKEIGSVLKSQDERQLDEIDKKTARLEEVKDRINEIKKQKKVIEDKRQLHRKVETEKGLRQVRSEIHRM